MGMKEQLLATVQKTAVPIKQVSIEPIKVVEMDIMLTGTTPLLMERMSEKVQQSLINTMEGKGKEKKQNRDFQAEVGEKIHRTEDGKPGFPASGFKKAIVEAAVYMDGMDKKLAKSIVIVGNVVPVTYKKMITNKAMGRDSGIRRAPRPIWRPEFTDWGCKLRVRFNSSLITPDQVVNLFKLGGFHIGIGGWRPQCSGSYGTFTVAQTAKEK